jgi:hypothetical protein
MVTEEIVPFYHRIRRKSKDCGSDEGVELTEDMGQGTPSYVQGFGVLQASTRGELLRVTET